MLNVKEISEPRFVSRLTRDTVALILAGGRGSRLKDLTKWRAKPAVPFGGKFRIIDFPLSNCINSGIRRVAVLTQYKSQSLIRHIQQGWGFLRGELGEFVEVVPAQQRVKDSWYSGTADAVYQNLDIINSHKAAYVLVLAGDHIYKMDYGPMLAHHVESGADMTVACIEVPLEEAKAFGVMSVEADDRIVNFAEKPEQPQPMPGRDDVALASMGIYVFNTHFLFEQVLKDAEAASSSHDFGHDIIPDSVASHKVYAYAFRDDQGLGANGDQEKDKGQSQDQHQNQNNDQAYWRDVGTVDAYWQANMELISVTPELNMYDDNWPIWTYQPQLPPAKFVFDEDGRRGMAIDSMVSGGCVVSGATVYGSLLFSNVRVNAYSHIEDSVILPDVVIGEGCRLKKTVIDKSCRLPPGTVIGEDPEEDARRFHVSPGGVVVVTPNMLGQDYHRVE